MESSAYGSGGLSGGRPTYFAPAERAECTVLLHDIELLSRNPLIDTLLKSVGGLLAILNEQRQILAVNDELLKTLGIKDPRNVFGLRPGEAIHCIHAHKMPGGCGTSELCSTCGAAIAIVTCLCEDESVERDCAATVEKAGRIEDLYFRVRATPLTIEKHRYVLLFLQDMTEHKRRAIMERVFLHDINNLIAGLVGNAELLDAPRGSTQSAAAEQIRRQSLRLAKEIQIHKAILGADGAAEIRIQPEAISAADVAREIQQVFTNHPVAKGKHLRLSAVNPDMEFRNDRSLLIRVLANAVTNAFESSADDDIVRFWYEPCEHGVAFFVWNNAVIPRPAALRVFQRSFTTKTGPGRGIGTYVMKLLTEQYLQGQVDFTTSAQDGTVFRICVRDLGDG